MTSIGTVEGVLTLKDQWKGVLNRASAQLDDFGKKFKKIGQDINRSAEIIEKFGKKAEKLGTDLKNVGQTLTQSVTLPLAAVGLGAAKLASDFESSFAGVRKTVNATAPEFAALEAGMRDLSKTIPVNVNELNRIGEAAGQLGIKTENILKFTETMAALGVATNLSSEQAATSLAQFANITQLPQESIDRLGSTIVALGNQFATTESKIVEMGLRIAGAGTQIGLTEGQILAFATSLSSVGIEAEAGGSAISKVMINMSLAVQKGGKELRQFAQVSGLSSKEFKAAFEKDAAAAIDLFIKGLGNLSQSGGNALKVLDDMGISEVRMRDALLRASGAGDVLTRALDLQAKAWEANTALTDEARERYKTFESQLTLVINKLKDAGITLGQELLPIFKDFLESVVVPLIGRAASLAEAFGRLPPGVRNSIVAVAALAAAIGPLLFITGQLITSFGVLVTAFPKVAAGLRLVHAAALGPFGLAIAAIIAGAALAAKAISDWADQTEADMARMAKAVNDFGRKFERFRGAIQLGVVHQSELDDIAADIKEQSKLVDDLQKKINELNKPRKLNEFGLPTRTPEQQVQDKKNLKELEEDLKSAQDQLNVLEGLQKQLQSLPKLKLPSIVDDPPKPPIPPIDEDLLDRYEEGIKNLQALVEENEALVAASKRGTDALARMQVALNAGIPPSLALKEEVQLLVLALEKLQLQLNIQDLARRLEEERLKAEQLTQSINARNESVTIDITLFIEDALTELLEEAGQQVNELVNEELEELDDKVKGINEQTRLQAQRWREVGSVLNQLGSTFDGTLGKLLSGVGQLVQALASAKEAATATEKALAGLAIGGAVASIGTSLGIFGSDNYGAELSTIGGLFGPWGAVVGGLLGAAMHKEADVARSAIEAAAGEIAISAGSNNPQMARAARDLAQSVADTVQNFVDALGGRIISFSKIEFRQQGDIIEVVSGRFKKQFRSIDDAIAFAVSQALTDSQIEGLGPLVQRVLNRGFTGGLDELQDTLEKALKLDALSIPQSAREIVTAMREVGVEFEDFINTVIKFGLSIQELSVAGGSLGGGLGQIRDSITGVTKSAQERFNEQSAIFNAELELRRQDLISQIEFVKARIELASTRNEFQQRQLEFEVDLVNSQLALLGLTQRAAGIAVQNVAELQARLAILEAALASLPTPILPSEFQGGRRGSGSSRNRAEERESILQQAEQARLAGTAAAAIASANLQFTEMVERVNRAGFSAEQAAQLISQFAEALERDVRQSVSDIENRVLTFGGRNELLSAIIDLQSGAADLRRELEALLEVGAISEDRFNKLTQSLNEASKAATEATILDAATSLTLDLLDLLGEEKQVAKIKFELALAELLIRREQLRLAEQELGIQISALSTIDELLERAQNLGPEGLAALDRVGDDTLNQVLLDIQALNGGAGFGQLSSDLSSISQTTDDLGDRLQNLFDAGQIGLTQLESAARDLENAARKAASRTASLEATNFLVELLELAGEEEQAARIRFELTLAELELRREELRLALARVDLEAQAAQTILAVLGRSEELLNRIRAIGPAALSGGGGGASGGGGSSGPTARDRALELLERLRENSLSEFVQQVRTINAEFAFLRDTLGNTAEIQELYSKALQDALDGLNSATQSLLDRIDLSTPSRDPLDRFLDLESRARAAVEAALADPTNIEARRAAEDLLSQLESTAQTILPTAGEGFADLTDFIRQSLRQFLDLDIDLESLGQSPFGPQSDPGFDRVVNAIRQQTIDLSINNQNIYDRLSTVLTGEQRLTLSHLGSNLRTAIDLLGSNIHQESINLLQVLDLLTDQQLGALGGLESVIEELLGSDSPQAQLLLHVASVLRSINQDQLSQLGGIGNILNNLSDIGSASHDWLRLLLQTVGWENLQQLGLLDPILAVLDIRLEDIRLGLEESLPATSGEIYFPSDITTAISSQVGLLRDVRESNQMSVLELRRIREILAGMASDSKTGTIGNKF